MSISRRATSAELTTCTSVRQVSGKVTMKKLEEQYVCVKFCCKIGKNFTETFQLQDAIVTVDGERVSSTKKAQMSQSKIKLLLVVFFDWKGIVYLVRRKTNSYTRGF